jgi:ankyrin repeat protein
MGQTPLHLAAMKGHLTVIKLLLHHGASPSAKDAVGCLLSNMVHNDSRADGTEHWWVRLLHSQVGNTPIDVAQDSEIEQELKRQNIV